jgi:hypothetical protein
LRGYLWFKQLSFSRLCLLSRQFLPARPPIHRNPHPGRTPIRPTKHCRNSTLSGEAISVTNLELMRDAGTFHLHSGTVCFVTPVTGRVTGAVFVGKGNFILDPPESERGMLKPLTKENEFSENFSQMALRFTDSTYDEIKTAGKAGGSGCEAGPLKDSQHATRHKFKTNPESRILEDLLSSEPGGLFIAFIHGKRYNDQEL